MHAPLCFGKFSCSVGKFSKATLAYKVAIVLFWKVFKSSIATCPTTGFVFFLEDGRCIPPILFFYSNDHACPATTANEI
jgi:hypothetical protein